MQVAVAHAWNQKGLGSGAAGLACCGCSDGVCALSNTLLFARPPPAAAGAMTIASCCPSLLLRVTSSSARQANAHTPCRTA